MKEGKIEIKRCLLVFFLSVLFWRVPGTGLLAELFLPRPVVVVGSFALS